MSVNFAISCHYPLEIPPRSTSLNGLLPLRWLRNAGGCIETVSSRPAMFVFGGINRGILQHKMEVNIWIYVNNIYDS